MSGSTDPRAEFAATLRNAGFQLSGDHPIMDGAIHRVPVERDRGRERNGSYRGFLDARPNGWFQNWKEHNKPQIWSGAAIRLTAEERESMQQTVEARRAHAQEKREQDAYAASRRALEILAKAQPAREHPYLTKKEVAAHGLFIAAPGAEIQTERGVLNIGGDLLVPINASDRNKTLMSMQIIDANGRKMFMPGAAVAGGSHLIGYPGSSPDAIIVEGYATGAALYEATHYPVRVAFSAHNLRQIAEEQRRRFPDQRIIIAGDNDHHLGARNVGVNAAREAARAVGGVAAIATDLGGARGTDWNDVRRQIGLAEMRRHLHHEINRGERQRHWEGFER